MIKEILNQFPLSRICFSKYIDWLEQQGPNVEDNDLVIALKNNEIERLKRLEERLVQAKSISGYPQSQSDIVSVRQKTKWRSTTDNLVVAHFC